MLKIRHRPYPVAKSRVHLPGMRFNGPGSHSPETRLAILVYVLDHGGKERKPAVYGQHLFN